MSNNLNTLNREITTLSNEISNVENKDSIILNSKRNATDVSSISNYINNVVVKSFVSLCSKERFPYDTIESGISGLTIQTYPEAQGNNEFNSELFWKAGATPEQGRPCTVKESFDYLLANMFEKIVEIRESTVNLDELWDSIGCLTLDLTKVKRDVFGDIYQLNCNSDKENVWPISRHIYEFLTQLTTGHNAANINSLNVDFTEGSVTYPTLSLNYTIPTLHEVLTAGNVSNLEAKVGRLTIVDTNNQNVFSLPQTDGQPNQVLKTDGSGVVSWASDSTNVADATEVVAGKVEIATVAEVANGDDVGGSGADIVVTPDALIAGIAITGTLRNRVKAAALEQIQESSIDELEDVDTSTVAPQGGQVLMWNQESEKWKPEDLDAAQTEYLGSVGQSSTLGDVDSDAGDFNLNTGVMLSFSKPGNEWYNAYRGGTSNINLYYSFNDVISKSEDYVLSGVSAGALLARKVPFTFCTAMLRENGITSWNSPDFTENDSRSFGELNSQLGYFGSHYLERQFKGFMSRRTSKHYVGANGVLLNEIFYKRMLGVNRVDLLFNSNIFSPVPNTQLLGGLTGGVKSDFENNFIMSNEEDLSNVVPVQKAGLSPIIVFGPYKIGDALYICPEYLLSKININYGIGICIAESFFTEPVLSASGGDPEMTMLDLANSTLQAVPGAGIDAQDSYEIINYRSADAYGYLNVGIIANIFIQGPNGSGYAFDSLPSYIDPDISHTACCNLLGVQTNSTVISDFGNKLMQHNDFNVSNGDLFWFQYSLVLGEIKVR